MRGMIIAGGRVLDPASGFDAEADVYCAEGRIQAIGEAPAGFEAEQRLDASGQWVIPGLVDLAARLREPGASRKGSIASETQAAVAGGITTVCLPPDTRPVIDSPSVVELIHRRAQEADAARVVPLGALTQDLAGELISEMAALRSAGCPAVDDGGRPLANSLVLRRAMEYAATQSLPVILSPRDPWLSRRGGMHEGQVATRLGLPSIPAAAETAALARDLALVETVGVRTHFARLSSARGAAALARARHEELPVSADVSIHHLFLTEMDVMGFAAEAHLEPPLRGQADREALRRALAEGVIDIICSDHQPHEPDAKAAPFGETEPGVSGVDSLLALVLRLVDEGALPLQRALACVTCNPARLLGLEAGRLAVGAPADLCVVDPYAVWWHEPASMLSQGKNSPYHGWEFTGRASHTLVGGRLVFRREP